MAMPSRVVDSEFHLRHRDEAVHIVEGNIIDVAGEEIYRAALSVCLFDIGIR